MDYYDLILGLIPLTMGGIAAALVVAGLNVTMAVPVGAVLATPLLGHAMFVRAPVPTPKPRETAATDHTQYNSAD
jgi:hypothetical protein